MCVWKKKKSTIQRWYSASSYCICKILVFPKRNIVTITVWIPMWLNTTVLIRYIFTLCNYVKILYKDLRIESNCIWLYLKTYKKMNDVSWQKYDKYDELHHVQFWAMAIIRAYNWSSWPVYKVMLKRLLLFLLSQTST